jgi:hypothetical protein
MDGTSNLLLLPFAQYLQHYRERNVRKLASFARLFLAGPRPICRAYLSLRTWADEEARMPVESHEYGERLDTHRVPKKTPSECSYVISFVGTGNVPDVLLLEANVPVSQDPRHAETNYSAFVIALAKVWYTTTRYSTEHHSESHGPKPATLKVSCL